MTPKLSSEVTEALHAAGDKPLTVVDATNAHVYLLIDPTKPQEAMEALRVARIQRGVESMEAGRGMDIDESQRLIEEGIRKRAAQ